MASSPPVASARRRLGVRGMPAMADPRHLRRRNRLTPRHVGKEPRLVRLGAANAELDAIREDAEAEAAQNGFICIKDARPAHQCDSHSYSAVGIGEAHRSSSRRATRLRLG